jgi:hypothetical protein
MFAVDWIGPDGIKPNAVHPFTFVDPSKMPLDFEGKRYLPFKTGELWYLLGMPIKPTYELIKSGRKFAYEVSPAGGGREWAGGLPGFDHAFQHISKPVIDAVKQDNAVIILNCSWEAHLFSSLGIFQDLTSSIEIIGLPPENIWVVTSNMLAMNSASSLCNGKSRIYVINFFENFVRRDLAKSPLAFVNENEARHAVDREKYFLCFNRRPRAHRQILLSELLDRGLIDQGFVSMPPADALEYNQLPDFASFPLIMEKIARLSERTPLVIDRQDFLRNHAGTHIKEPYLSSWFSVVSETFFFGENYPERMFISEKTFKPIANHQPFIVVGLPGSLAALRSLGYMTFSPFIDESYDDEQDPMQRMAMIVDEISRLCSLSKTEIRDWYESLIPVLVHNARIIRSSDTFSKFRQDLNHHLVAKKQG